MNQKEVSEIRRRFRPDRSNITHIRGCFVNEKGEIVTQFNQSLALMDADEGEKFLALLKRTLSGTLGKNLLDISFSTQQVVDSPEHRLLMDLRSSALKDDQVVQTFFQQVIGSLSLEDNYLILLAQDTYDVPHRSQDAQGDLEDADSEVYSYILCSICPVKQTKPALSYSLHENEFHNQEVGFVVAAPELGFLFPAFDARTANIYNALYYSRSASDSHTEFVNAIFHQDPPMPAQEQKETFQFILGDTLAQDCRFEVVQTVDQQLREMIQEHKEAKEEEPLTLSKGAVKAVLSSCGVEPERVHAFEERYDRTFGADAQLPPKNLIETKFEVQTPDVVIRVKPECSDLVQTRIIDGRKYILIRADEGVQVNGVDIHIS